MEKADVKEELERIASGGSLTPDAVVEAARSEENPLHRYFEWDDEKAGHAHRIHQARMLIRSVRVIVTIEDRPISTVYYVRDPEAGDQQGYVSLPRLRNDAELARHALVQEFARAASILMRVRNLAEALQMEGEIDETVQQLTRMREKVQAQSVAA